MKEQPPGNKFHPGGFLYFYHENMSQQLPAFPIVPLLYRPVKKTYALFLTARKVIDTPAFSAQKLDDRPILQHGGIS